MKAGTIIKVAIIIVALLTFIFATIYVAKASPPMPIGTAGKIVVNNESIDDGYVVTVKNEDTGEEVYAYTENGYFVVGVSGIDGDEITASVEYDGVVYSNSTIVDTSRATQWINISISTSNPNDDDNDTNDEETENEKPVILIPDTFEGTVGDEIVFDASSCYDPDGYITKYEWTFYDYPPSTLTGKIVKKVFNNVCNIMGIITVYDNDCVTSSKTFNVVINQQSNNDSENENNSSDSSADENNSSNDTVITVPPMPPIANFTCSEGFYENNTLYVNMTSTSTDADGYIVNWTWTVEGELYYGENITVIVPIVDENESFAKLNVTLLVTDNDGLYDDVNAVITFNTSYINSEKHHLIIYSEEPVSIKLSRDGQVLDEDSGTHFEYYLPSGDYSVVYTYNGMEFDKNINLDADTDIMLDIPTNQNHTPAFGLLAVLIAFGVIIYVRKKN